MKILVVGATGATGRLLVDELLKRGHNVKAIVRSPEKLLPTSQEHSGLHVIRASLLDLSDAELAGHADGCTAVASCLGHNLSLRGIYGQPRRLVTDAVRRLCKAVKTISPDQLVKYILMNTTGNRNHDLVEPISIGEKIVLGLVRLLLPPQKDNEQAAEYLRTAIGKNDDLIEWAAVRPDSLTDEDDVTDYKVHPSPIRSAIFDAGKTSRINVAHFMADLITNDVVWNKWKGRMPVIYNKSE